MPELKLEQKLSLKQVLTPQLIQSLQLLQIPKLELAAELRAELEQNPMLEIIDNETEIDESDLDRELDRELDEWDNFASGLSLYGSQLPENDPDEEEVDPYFGVSSNKTLYEHLIEQLSITVTDERKYKIGEFIIGNLDSKGFLAIPDERLRNDAERLRIVEPPPSLDEITETINIIQGFNPAGIAARNLQESFLIQLTDSGEEGSLAWIIVEDYFEELKCKNVPQLADILGVSIADVESAMVVLGSLSFAPAADYTGQSGGIIDPDLIVEKVQGRWVVRYNGAGIPELRINGKYRAMLKNRDSLDISAKKFLSKKLNSAQWWIQSLQQRKDTMVRTMRAILHHQFPFFENGPANLLPLKMEEIADEVGVHPATISRVVRDKYVQTPYGVFPLRHFFGGGLATESGEDIATTIVKRRIRAFIAEEDPARPYADQKITEALNNEGIKIARRTVAKYREEMGIPTARMRKKKRK
ncbi:RNA polymerase sigma-54 factor [bacterium]|nr:MAG: RNA polymerase sigma-54 factor [bacterium]